MNLHHLKEIQQDYGSESNLPEQAPTTDEGSVSEKFQSAVNYDYTKNG